MKKFNQSTFAFVLLLFGIQTLNAGSLKKYAGEFLYLGADGRGAAMGSAFTAISNDVTSIYWNPAGLTEARGLQAQFMHSKRFIDDIRQSHLSISSPVSGNATLGASFYYLTANDNPDNRDAYNEVEGNLDYDKIKWFNVGDYVFTLAYAQQYNSDLSWGLNVKFIYSDFKVETATGIGFDAGVKYKIEQLQLGMVLRDFTSTLLAWSTGTKEFITPSARLGAAYDFYLPSLKLNITPALDLNILAENRDFSAQFNVGPLSLDVLTGMELTYDNLLALRFGMDDIQRLNAGIGVNLPKITVDYAFTAYESELGNIHRISFHLFLGDIL